MIRPPRVTEALLRVVLSDGVVGRSILGDLCEEFGWRLDRGGERPARRWYRRAATGLIARRLLARVWDVGGWSARTRSNDEDDGRRGDPMVMQWMSEMSLAVRALTRAPGFSVITTLTLGLAIGANAAIFSVVNGVLLSPLPYDNADELVAILSSTPGNNTPPDFGVSPEFYLQYRDNASLLESVALVSDFGGTIMIDGAGKRVRGAEVTRSFFETLGVQPTLGRLPTVDEVAGGSTPTQRSESGVDVVLISHAFWTQDFGADPSIIGRTVNLNDIPRTIIGVLPPDLAISAGRVSRREVDRV